MSAELDPLIVLGHDIIAAKYYGVATTTILFFDYLLTLADEIEYFWFKKKTWTFWLFMANRYFPMTYKLIPLSYLPYFNQKACDRATVFFVLTMVVCTLIAQVALTARIYAVTMKNTAIAIGFAILTASQFVLGIYVVALTVIMGAQKFPPIPLDAYRVCIFVPHRALEIAYTGISLLYDSLAFSLIMFFAARSGRKMPVLKTPTTLGIVAEDAAWYFLVIFTSHFVLEMTILFGRKSIQLLPGSGLVVYLPVMASRIMLSLRKAADSNVVGWSLVEIPVDGSSLQAMEFFRPQRGTNSRGDDIPPEMYTES